ncbi:extracellular solute-binding protein [Halobellus rufus]|uniref:extracellular solute-binding protein n=1 Tax=Halobellus rufus TaxID=1448860 RepID=UPI0009DEEE9C|nr:extracellular solute-binding protein [Halobellus rufus]
MTNKSRHLPTRRDSLKILGVSIAGLAGCTSGNGGSNGDSSADSSSDGSEPTTSQGTTAGSSGSDLEDEMTIYTTTDYSPVIEAFENEYDVTVNASVYSGPQTTTRFRTEEEAGNHNASAVIGSADGLAWPSVRQYLTEVDLPEENRNISLNDAREEQLSQQDAVGKSWPILSILRGTPYSTTNVDTPPIEWGEFTNSEWENRLINPPYNMRRIYLTLQLQGWDDQRVEDYMIALDENMSSYPTPAPANVQQIIGGQSDVGVQILTHFLGGPMNDGAPVDVAYPSFTSEHYNAVGVSANAPSPNAAKAFAKFATTEAGQRPIQEGMGLNPVAPNLDHGNSAIQERIDEYDPTIIPLIPTEQQVNDSTEYLNEILSIEVG